MPHALPKVLSGDSSDIMISDHSGELEIPKRQLELLQAEPIDGMLAYLTTLDVIFEKCHAEISESFLEVCLLEQMKRSEEYAMDIKQY